MISYCQKKAFYVPLEHLHRRSDTHHRILHGLCSHHHTLEAAHLVGGLLIILFFGLPILLLWDLKAILGADFSFWTAWLYAYALFMGFNLWDLVVLDWVGISLIDPQNPPIPGTVGAAGWRDYAFHFYGFLKGCVMGLVFAAFEAGVITLFA